MHSFSVTEHRTNVRGVSGFIDPGAVSSATAFLPSSSCRSHTACQKANQSSQESKHSYLWTTREIEKPAHKNAELSPEIFRNLPDELTGSEVLS
jgi:hypothetical protein